MPDPARLPWWRVLLVFLITGGLLAFAVFKVLTPVWGELAKRYVARGDTYLIGQQFEEAGREYKKALRYQADNQQALTNLNYAEAAPTDPAAARAFFTDHNVKSVLDKLAEAEQSFSTPKEALAAGVKLYSQGEYQYAQYPLQKAVELDPKYPEAWHYLALTYGKLAEQNASYRAKSEQAQATRDALTSKYLTP